MRLARCERMPLTPLAQRHHHREEVTTGLGERVYLPPTRRGRLPVENAAVDETAQPVGEDVARNAGALLKVTWTGMTEIFRPCLP